MTEKKRRTVGAIVTEALMAGKNNEEVLALVQKERPDRHTTASSVAWYRKRLRAEGYDVPTSRSVNQQRKRGAPDDPLSL